MHEAANTAATRLWYGTSGWYRLLLPLSWLFALAVACRNALYRRGLFHAYEVPVPVIVVGNITAGGTGKSPLCAWLVKELEARGHSPAIISRGYRGKIGALPLAADADSDPAIVGDEAVMLARQTDCVVVVHPERVAAATRAVELGADVIVADDGLQHYRLARDFEIAVVDGVRGFGNGRLLPAGPLREPVSRLDRVDKVIVQRQRDGNRLVLRRASDRRPLTFMLTATSLHRLDGSEVRPLSEFAGQKMHAVAGIGNPERFFRLLEAHHVRVQRHALPDHAPIRQRDLLFNDSLDVVMTEKDAVKCRGLETGDCWTLPVEVAFDGSDAAVLLRMVG